VQRAGGGLQAPAGRDEPALHVGTSLGGRRVKVTASRTVLEVATGSATVKKGRYTAILRSRVPLSAGTYAYKHVVTTDIRTHRVFAIRLVRIS
jgi:hypothetical protein